MSGNHHEIHRKRSIHMARRWLYSSAATIEEGAMAISKYDDIKIVDIMTKGPLTVTPEDTVGQADEIMAEKKIRQLPVVNGRELLGIITDRDIRSFLSGS